MPAITVKNVPGALYQDIKRSAEQHHRSMNGEIIACLERALHSHASDAEAIIERARNVRKKNDSFRLNEKILQSAKRMGRE